MESSAAEDSEDDGPGKKNEQNGFSGIGSYSRWLNNRVLWFCLNCGRSAIHDEGKKVSTRCKTVML